MRSLTQLQWLRVRLIGIKRLYLTKFWGMDIHPSALFSLSAYFDITNPKGIHLGEDSYVAFGAVVFSHDGIRGKDADTWIGRRCFVGARSIILPGVRIGDESVVGTGSVVTKDVPPRCIVAGNPAKIIRSGIKLDEIGVVQVEHPRDRLAVLTPSD